MSSAQLTYNDIQVGDKVRPYFHFMGVQDLVDWGQISGNTDAGHWHYFCNMWKQDREDPNCGTPSGQPPTVTGQYKMALFERMLIDWCGPKTWVKRIEAQYRTWDYLMECKTFTGVVTGKRVDGEQYLIEVQLQMANHHGQVTTKGSATMVIPAG
jgi:hypothetical protein